MKYTDYNGYIVAGTLKSDNAGFSKWGIAQKDGQEYFLKEFLSPVYPQNAEMYSASQAEKKRKYCERYEAQKMLLYKTINDLMETMYGSWISSAAMATTILRCHAFQQISSRQMTFHG